MKLKPNLLSYLIICLLFWASSCSLFDKDDGDPGTSKLTSIEIGPTIEVASSTIPASGGIIKVSKPDTPVDGMEITIPANSFSTGQTVTVSYSEIESHNLGQYFNPISPMITIAYNGGYANKLVSIEIPVKIPDGYFAMGFLYNEVTGEVEGMPLLSIKEKSVVVATRHFATSSLSGKSTNSLLKNMIISQEPTVIGNLVISAISIEELKKQTDIVSDFEPGYDDWEFTNYGSFVSPTGICSGMCLAAMWYYINETANGSSKLFHKYDKKTIANYAELWQDNTLGIKFSSMVHFDYENNNKTYENAIDKIAKDKTKDSLSWYAFAYSILQTKQPQFIGIMSSAGGGHVIIANEVWMQDGKLWISDPNHPGNKTLKVLYTNKEFEPYYASLNATENPFNFEYIAYYGKTAVVDWSLLSQRWDELNNGTIGNGVFPDKKLWISDPTGDTQGWELADGLQTVMDTLNLKIKDNGNSDYTFTIFDSEGYPILPSPKDKYSMTYNGKISLKSGLNIIGYCLYHKTKDQSGQDKWDWSDFKWIDVNYFKLEISPNPIAEKPDKEITVYAMTGGTAPKSAKYVWDFGDDSPQVTKQNDSIATHTYTKEGTFNIKVKLYDNETSKLLASATALANIGISLFANTEWRRLLAGGQSESIVFNLSTYYVYMGIDSDFHYILMSAGDYTANGNTAILIAKGDPTPDVVTINGDILTWNTTYTKVK